MTHSPALQKVPPNVVSLADHEQHARQHLDDNAWAYFSGGAADEITLRANRSAWDALTLWPRVLRPLAGGHTRVSLLGRTLVVTARMSQEDVGAGALKVVVTDRNGTATTLLSDASGLARGSVALSPRGDWRMPSDAEATAWLAEIA